MKIDKKSIAIGMLALGLVTTAGASVTAAAQNEGYGNRGGHAEIAAQLLGVTSDDFKSRVQNGENPREILEAAGITKDDMRAAQDIHRQERTEQAIADGRITQEEVDARTAKHIERKATHEAARSAVESNDYTAWATAIADSPMAENATTEMFATLVEAHTLHETGDHEGARALMQESGIEKPGKHQRGAFK